MKEYWRGTDGMITIPFDTEDLDICQPFGDDRYTARIAGWYLVSDVPSTVSEPDEKENL